jgi:hypothetical protein
MQNQKKQVTIADMIQLQFSAQVLGDEVVFSKPSFHNVSLFEGRLINTSNSKLINIFDGDVLREIVDQELYRGPVNSIMGLIFEPPLTGVTLSNTPIVTTEGIYRYFKISIYEARNLLKNGYNSVIQNDTISENVGKILDIPPPIFNSIGYQHNRNSVTLVLNDIESISNCKIHALIKTE